VTAYVRLYEELQDHLPVGGRCLVCHMDSAEPVENVLSRLGVPLEQVDLILVNGVSADSGTRIGEGDEVSVFPVFESFDIGPVSRLPDRPLRRARFVADVHLGKLATYLRMLGFDTLYRNDYQDQELVEISVAERRVLLTRDRRLIEDSGVTRGYRIRESDPRQQLGEVVRRFDLYSSFNPFCRCLGCNVELESVSRESVLRLLPPAVRLRHDIFWRCTSCGRVYWKGSHVSRMTGLITSLIAERDNEAGQIDTEEQM
jgi:uncharacterized protein with PIN domain